VMVEKNSNDALQQEDQEVLETESLAVLAENAGILKIL